MSIKSKLLSAAAALTLVGGLAAAGALTAGPARAATPSCGDDCINVFSLQFGSHRHPNFLVDVYRQGSKVGQPIILFRASSGDPALDFTVSDLDFCVQDPTSKTPDIDCSPMTLAELATFIPISSAVLASYGNFYVYENEYSPFGVNSGLCMGVAATPTNGEGVTLQNCGVSAKTVWIADERKGETFHHTYIPLINAATTNFTHPYVLTYPVNGFPTDLPRPQLFVHTLQTFSNGYPHVVTNQLWGADFGVFPGFN